MVWFSERTSEEYDLVRQGLTNEKILEMPIVLLSCLQYSFGKVHSMRVLFKTEEELETI